MKLDTLCLQLARDLNDAEVGYEFTLWTKEQIIAWINDAIVMVYNNKPLNYVEEQKFQLSPGSVQKLPDNSMVVEIKSQVDSSGFEIGKLVRRSPKIGRRSISLKRCISQDFLLDSYYLNSKDNGVFYVDPPVPPNKAIFVSLLATRLPSLTENPNNDVDINAEDLPILKEWVMYKAMMVDNESSANLNTAQIHLKNFQDAVGLTYKIQRDTKKEANIESE